MADGQRMAFDDTKIGANNNFFQLPQSSPWCEMNEEAQKPSCQVNTGIKSTVSLAFKPTSYSREINGNDQIKIDVKVKV